MKVNFHTILSASLILTAFSAAALALPDGPYFGLEPPGMTPVIFGPNVVCFPGVMELSCTFSPDQREFILCGYSTTSYAQRLEDDSWTPLGSVYFAPNCGEPHFAPDGNHFFCNYSEDVYTSERIGDTWSDAVKINYPISSSSLEYFPCPAANGNLYFCSTRSGAVGGCAIYRSIPVASQYTTVEQLPAPINTSYSAWDPLIAQDESYMILAVGRAGYGQADLFISFQTEPDSWTTPKNLGPIINTGLIEYGPHLSPDGKYFFFTRLTGWSPSDSADIYWVDIRAIFPAGDFTRNGRVDFDDFAVLAAYWLTNEPSVDIAPEPPDGIIDFQDLATFAQHWLEAYY